MATKDTPRTSGLPSSDEESHVIHKLKRKGNIRACDACRRKKIRCEFNLPGDPSKPCINCAVFKTECTFTHVHKKRKSTQGYVFFLAVRLDAMLESKSRVEGLQRRIEKLERLVTALAPGIDLSQDFDEHTIPAAPQPQSTLPISSPEGKNGKSSLAEWRIKSDVDDETSDEDGPYYKSGNRGYFGTSSGLNFLRRLVDLKIHDGNDELLNFSVRSVVDQPEKSHRRQRASMTFPDIPLMFSLFEHYFRIVNIFFPIIHRSSFEADVRGGRHIVDPGFGAVVLLVCAIGSRWSDDERVLSKTYRPTSQDFANNSDWTSTGWDYYAQAYDMYRRDHLTAPLLHDLQMMALGSIYMQNTPHPSLSWQLSGYGVRLGIEVGAHRRAMLKNLSEPVQVIMWKRVFWVLVVLDRINSAIFGRPCAICDEDIDTNLPCLVDEEYFTPEANFTQPVDKPSRILYLISMIKLTQILVYALKVLYPTRKSRTTQSTASPTCEQDNVAAFDSALNSWVDSIPEHLQWNPSRQTDETTFYQSASLYIHYHYIQVIVHRHYIMRCHKKYESIPTAAPPPSLAICTNAARSCSRIFRVLLERRSLMTSELGYFAYSMAGILLYNIWGSNVGRSIMEKGRKADREQKLEDFQSCLGYIDLSVARCYRAQRISYVLHKLIRSELPDCFTVERKMENSQPQNYQQQDEVLHQLATPFRLNDNPSFPVKHYSTVPVQGKPSDFTSYTTEAPSTEGTYEGSGSSFQGPSSFGGSWPAEPQGLFDILEYMYPVESTAQHNISMHPDLFQSQGPTSDMGWLPSPFGFPSSPIDRRIVMTTNSNKADPTSQNEQPDLGADFNSDWLPQSTHWS